MSLINQVLRDLDRRRAGGPGGVPSGVRAVDGGAGRGVVAAMGALILILGAMTGFLLWERSADNAGDAGIAAGRVSPVSVAPVPLPPATDPAPVQRAGAGIAAPPPSSSPRGDEPPPRPSLPAREQKVADARHPTRPAEPPAPATAAPGIAPEHGGSGSAPAPVRPTAAAGNAVKAVKPSGSKHSAGPKTSGRPSKAVFEKRVRPFSAAQRAARAYADALAALRQRDRDEAKTKLRAALEARPDHADAREAFAGVLMAEGRWVEAGALLAEGVRRHPEDRRFPLLHARVLMEQKDLPGAIRVLEQGVPAAMQDAEYMAFLAALYQRAGRYGESVNAYRRALDRQPTEAAWRVGMAISLEHSGERDQATQEYARALVNWPLAEPLRRHAEERLRQLKGK